MDIEDRIRQFETMVRPEADPNNDMAWFSLGQAYAQAGRHEDSARAFERCTQINPQMSKAYQLAGEALAKIGELARASEVLSAGYKVAASRGDRLPQKGIEELLVKLGQEVPKVEPKGPSPKKPAAGTTAGGGFVCRRTGQPGTRMARAPFRNELGAWIQANISDETFRGWVAQGTKVINEMRLDLSKDEDAATYERLMCEYLGMDEELRASLQKGG